jgi:hypothetical protein
MSDPEPTLRDGETALLNDYGTAGLLLMDDGIALGTMGSSFILGDSALLLSKKSFIVGDLTVIGSVTTVSPEDASTALTALEMINSAAQNLIKSKELLGL